MIFLLHQIIIFSLLSILPLSSSAQNTNSTECDQVCGKDGVVPYPFGFSDGCKIKLNCSSNSGNIQIANFLVQNVTSDQILISLPTKCNRPIKELSGLFGPNFAPTWRNGLLFENCSSPLNECLIPSRSTIASADCDFNDYHNMSCYFNQSSKFLDYGEVISKENCSILFSSIMVDSSVSAVALEFETVEVGWWVDGECDCDSNANCTPVVYGRQQQGFRCKCNEGYAGDGFAAGKPCRRVHTSGQRKTRISLALKITIPIASMFLVFVACLLAWISLSRKKQVKNMTQSDFLHKGHQIITYYELRRATESFNECQLLGKGSSAAVYKANLSDGTIAAIKVLNMQYEGALKNFDAECKVLSNVRHRNLVKVISTCSNVEFKAMVLEFMPNGSLDKWLYSETNFLTLDERLDIVIDVSMAMEYLHHEYTAPIVHCDLKPSNVLLDENMTAHVADFGIAKILAQDQEIMQTKTLGTIGYIAPEYGLDGNVSTRGDVYSFGILLLETFTGKKPIDDTFSDDLSLPQWVNRSFPDAVSQVLDPNLFYDSNSYLKDGRSAPLNEEKKRIEEVVASIFHVALLCLKNLPEERIEMRGIVVQLKKIGDELRKSCVK